MTLFEYLAIAFSLVLSSAAMRLVAGLPYAVQPNSRYWVHIVAVCGQLLLTTGVFWVFWSYQAVTWNLPRFYLALASPGLVYFNACTIIPESPSSVANWRDHFYSVRRRWYFGMLCWGLVTCVISTVVLDMPWSHPARIAQAAVVTGGGVGAASSSERVQEALAVVLAVLMVAMAGVIGSQPAALAP